MPALLTRPVNFISELEPQNRTIIALAGLPGSGKSTLADNIAEEVNAIKGEGYMKSLGMDGFHLTCKQLSLMPDPEEALKRRGAPWTFNAEGLTQKMSDLRNGATVFWPEFEHGSGDPVEDAIEILPTVKVIMVEGLYLLYRENIWSGLDAKFDQLWFLNTSEEISFNRLIARHRQTKGLSQSQAVERANGNDVLNGKIVLATREHADYLVESL